MRDMKVDDSEAKGKVKKSALDAMHEEPDDDEDSDDGEVIDRSARTDYYDLPTQRRPRGTAPPGGGGSGVMGDDGTVWPAP